MKTPALRFSSLLLCLSLLLASCERDDVIKDPAKQIVSFSLKKKDGSAFAATELTVLVQGFQITITVPYNTDLSHLVPDVAIKGISLSPASGVAQDFSQPVVYTVTAEDGSTVVYTVTVQKAPPPPAMVYIGSSDNNFYALDAATGELKWKYAGTDWFVYSSPTYADSTVYVGGIDNYVYAFNARTGAVKWRYRAADTGIESDAVVVNGVVYVGTNDDYLYALDAATGLPRWRFLTGANVSSSPTVANGVVYFGSSDGKLYALDATTGERKWAYATGGMLNQSGPALVDGVLYVGSRDSYLYAIEAATGTLKWRFYADGISLEQSSPTVANGKVYIGAWYDVGNFSRKGSLYCVSAASGQLVWQALHNTGVGSSPTVWNGRVYVTADDTYLHALDAATGAPLWSRAVLANGASPAVSDGVLFVGGGGTGSVYAFDALTGAEKWRFRSVGHTTTSPLVVNNAGKADHPGDSGLQP